MKMKMCKSHKYLSIIIPFFLAIGIQIGIGIAGGLIYSLIYFTLMLLSTWEFMKDWGIDFSVILDKMVTIDKSLPKVLTMLSAVICIIVFYIWSKKYNPKDVNTKMFSILSIKSISLLFFLSLCYRLLEIGAFNLIISGFYYLSI